jgi:hypothetical protein
MGKRHKRIVQISTICVVLVALTNFTTLKKKCNRVNTFPTFTRKFHDVYNTRYCARIAQRCATDRQTEESGIDSGQGQEIFLFPVVKLALETTEISI